MSRYEHTFHAKSLYILDLDGYKLATHVSNYHARIEAKIQTQAIGKMWNTFI